MGDLGTGTKDLREISKCHDFECLAALLTCDLEAANIRVRV